MPVFQPGVFQPDVFQDADEGGGGSGSFSVNAVIRARSFSADAIRKRTFTFGAGSTSTLISVANAGITGGWPGAVSGFERHSNTGSTVVTGPSVATTPGATLDAFTGYVGDGAYGDGGGGRWQLWTGPTADQVGGSILADTGLKSGNFGAAHYGGTVPSGHFYAWFGYRDNIWYKVAELTETVPPTGMLVNAVVGTPPPTGSFLLNAALRKTLSASFAANAVLLASRAGSFPTSAVLRRTTAASLLVDARLRSVVGTQEGSFPLDAALYLQPTEHTGSFTVDAILRETRMVGSTLDAVIQGAPKTGSFTVNATLVTLIFEDFFSRSTNPPVVPDPGEYFGSGGLGFPWAWVAWDNDMPTSDQSISYVDGSTIVVPFASVYEYESYIGYPMAAAGHLTFDWLAPTTVPSFLEPSYGLAIDSDSGAGPFIWATTSGDPTNYEVGNGVNDAQGVAFEAVPGAWHRVHAMWDTASGRLAINAWERTQPEPPGWMFDLTGQLGFTLESGRVRDQPVLDIYYRPTSEDGRIDNVRVWSMSPVWRMFGGINVAAWIGFPINVITGSLTANAIRMTPVGGESKWTPGITLTGADPPSDWVPLMTKGVQSSGVSASVPAFTYQGAGFYVPYGKVLTANFQVPGGTLGYLAQSATPDGPQSFTFSPAPGVRTLSHGYWRVYSYRSVVGAVTLNVTPSVLPRSPAPRTVPVNAILLTRTPRGFMLRAFIRTAGTFGGGFELDALLVAEAMLDTFSRVVPVGLGGRWLFNRGGYDETDASVDGSVAIEAAHSETQWIGYPKIWEGLVQWDVFLASVTDTEFFTGYDTDDGRSVRGSSGMEVEAWVDEGVLYADIWPFETASDEAWLVAVPYTANTWYTIKAYLNQAPGSDSHLKIWERGTPEPADWMITFSSPIPVGGNFWSSAVYFDGQQAYPAQYDNFWVRSVAESWLTDRYFALDAMFSRGHFRLDAVLEQGLVIEAIIGRRSTVPFTVNAVIGPSAPRIFLASATIRTSQPRTFTANAAIRVPGLVLKSIRVDAWLETAGAGQLTVAAVIDNVLHPAFSAPLDAFLIAPVDQTMTVDAVIDDGHRLRSFAIDADLMKQGERRGQLSVAAVIGRQGKGIYLLQAVIEERTLFRARAWLAGRFSLDAVKRLPAGAFTVNARIALRITRISSTTANAVKLATQVFPPELHLIGDPRGIFVDAVIADANGAFPDHGFTTTADAVIQATPYTRPFWIDAVIVEQRLSFALDAALVAPPVYTPLLVDAYIGNTTIIWPDEQSGGDGSTLVGDTFTSPTANFTPGMVGSTITINGVDYTIVTVVDPNTVIVSPTIPPGQGGLPWVIQPPATDAGGNPVPDWFKTSRKYRIGIFLDGVEVTGDVNWSRTSFTQNAKTNPGTFEVVLYGVQAYDGGEELIVTIDDLRVFGGYVLSVERGYLFEAEATWINTILRGADFNVLFDKLIVYNKDSVPDASGKYHNWKSFKTGTLDTTIIRKVFSSYVDLPPGFDYLTYLETVGTAAPEKPWTMPESGSPLRQVMQSISQVTTGVWWIDPYLFLHYGSRSTITAPHPITDGLGGISSQAISMSEDISQVVTETLVWGTLAYTVEGDIRVAHRTSDAYATLGPWQSAEFRSDLHHTAYINRRANSIIDRYGLPIKRAKMVIFEPGYQAGQVADVRLANHGLTAVLVIRSMTLTMAVIKERNGDVYYGVPRYELSVGLDPEEPWDIYDYLPFDQGKTPWYDPWKRDRRRGDKWPPPFDMSTFVHGENSTRRSYINWGTFEIRNGNKNDNLSVIGGPTGTTPWGRPYWSAAFPNGIYKSPITGASYSLVSQVANAQAGFESRTVIGGMGFGLSATGNAGTVDGWTEFVGLTEEWPGHTGEGVFSHQVDGGLPITVASGDLELRRIMVMSRNARVPITLKRAKLVSQTGANPLFDVKALVRTPGITAYYGPGNGVSYHVEVMSGGLNTDVIPNVDLISNVIADGEVQATVFVDTVYNAVLAPQVEWTPNGAPDLSFKIGEPGCPVDVILAGGTSMPAAPNSGAGIWCTLESGQWGAYPSSGPSFRWPADPPPQTHLRLCPFHFGILNFCKQVFGHLPAQVGFSTNIVAVDVTWETAAGWGLSADGLFKWAAGSDAYYDDDLSYDYRHQSYVTEEGGILELLEPYQEKAVYNFAQASVRWDERVLEAPRGSILNVNSVFEFTGRFGFGEGVGNPDDGPYLDFDIGYPSLSFIPGAQTLLRNWQSPSLVASPVDLYQTFHVQVAQSQTGWGLKIWQSGAPKPTAWFDWRNVNRVASISDYASFILWQDNGASSDRPFLPVRIRFICEDWGLVEGGAAPITFSGGQPVGNPASIIDGDAEDLEGELFGAVHDGWGCETIPVLNGHFTTTGLVTTGTMRVYDADDGTFLYQDDDWADNDGDGKDFAVMKAGVLSVVACYRNYVQNIGNRPRVPRDVTPSISILGERHIPT